MGLLILRTQPAKHHMPIGSGSVCDAVRRLLAPEKDHEAGVSNVVSYVCGHEV